MKMKRMLKLYFLLVASLLTETLGREDSAIEVVWRGRRNAVELFSNLSINDTNVARIDYEVNLPWEQFIAPSPTIVALIGQLMVVSGRIDVDLRPYAPTGGFKQMRYPNSFRASLVQVSNEAWSAFMVAHRNMDKIQLYMAQIPDQVKTVFKIFALQSPVLIENFLPPTLTKIQEISQRCVEVSAETVTNFTNVMSLLGELLEATESGRGGHENQMAQVQIELNVSMSQKEYYQNIGDEIKKEKQQIEAQVNKLRREYDDAFNKIPTGWDAMLQRLANVPISFLENVVRNNGGGGFGGNGSLGGKRIADFAKSAIFSIVRSFFNTNADMRNKVEAIFKGKLMANGTGSQSTMFSAFKIELNCLEKMINTYPQSDLAIKVIQILTKAKSMCQEFEGIFSDTLSMGDLNRTTQASIMGDFNNLETQLKEMLAQAEKFTGSLTTTGQDQVENQPNSNFQGVGVSERYKAQLKLNQLNQAESRYDQYFGELMKYNEEMKTLMGKIARLRLQEVNFKEILELLKEGIRLLSKIRAQWSKLIEFFQMIATRAEVTMNGYLIPEFTKHANIGQGLISRRQFGPIEKAFFFGRLKEQAVEINKAAFYLYTLSNTYFEVSSRYLMSPLAGLAEMLTITAEDARQRKLIELESQATQTHDTIKEMAKQRRLNYRQLVEAKRREFQEVITKMGGVNEDDMKLIRSIGFEN